MFWYNWLTYYVVILITVWSSNITYVKKTLNKNEEGEEGSKLKAVEAAEAIIKTKENGIQNSRVLKLPKHSFTAPVVCTEILEGGWGGGGGH